MNLKELLSIPCAQWPKDDFDAQQALYPEAFRALMNDGRMHDYIFIELQYLNAMGNSYANPTFMIELSDGKIHYELIFPHVNQLQIDTPEPLENYLAEFENVMSTAVHFENGRLELVMRFASEWSIYVNSTGIDVRKVDWM